MKGEDPVGLGSPVSVFPFTISFISNSVFPFTISFISNFVFPFTISYISNHSFRGVAVPLQSALPHSFTYRGDGRGESLIFTFRKCIECWKLLCQKYHLIKYIKLEGTALYGCLLLAPAEGWWPSATWRALQALWIAVWIAVLAETTSVWIAVLAETTSVILHTHCNPVAQSFSRI